jgi:hypothetical protein
MSLLTNGLMISLVPYLTDQKMLPGPRRRDAWACSACRR